METTETAMETDGDGSGGTSPSWQGAEIETSIPRNLSAAAELRNYFWKIADSFRVFRPEASYRQRGIIRGQPGVPHTWVARPGPGPRQPGVWGPRGPTPPPLWFSGSFRAK
jgi:hypothetical protein